MFKSSVWKFYCRHLDLVTRYAIFCVTKDHGYARLVICTFRSFPHSWLSTGFVTIVTRRVLLVEQERSLLPIFSRVHVARSLIFYIIFYIVVSLCLFSICHCVVWPSIEGFWLALNFLLSNLYNLNVIQQDSVVTLRLMFINCVWMTKW